MQACPGRSEARWGPESSACVLLHPPMPPEGMGTPPVGLTVRWLGLRAVGRPYGEGRAGPLDCWVWASRARKGHLGVVQAGATTSQQAAHEQRWSERAAVVRAGLEDLLVGPVFAFRPRFPLVFYAQFSASKKKHEQRAQAGWFPA